MKDKMPIELTAKTLKIIVSPMEASLLAQLRTIQYGEVSVVIYIREGVPIRVRLTEKTEDKILKVKDGMNIDGVEFVGEQPKLDNFSGRL